MEFDLENPLSDSIPPLFHLESAHMPSENYSQSLKSKGSVFCIRVESISQISHLSCKFDPFVSYLAVNYLDRFLSEICVPQGKPWVVRLLAVTCVSLAMKMRKAEFSVVDAQSDEGLMFDAQTIRRMELLILGALKWRMRSVTPFSFFNFFISLFSFKDPPLIQALRSRATEIIFKAQNAINTLEFNPSILAASSLLSASHELFPLQFPCFRKAVSSCTHVNKDELFRCQSVVLGIAMDGYESVMEAVSSSSTPVNVLDRRCSSSDSGLSFQNEETNDSEEGNTSTTITKVLRLDRDLKRRKVCSFENDRTSSFQLSQVQHC
ncbi:hypothetical protein NMG60_11003051 [Bertholletia excelsa]